MPKYGIPISLIEEFRKINLEIKGTDTSEAIIISDEEEDEWRAEGTN